MEPMTLIHSASAAADVIYATSGAVDIMLIPNVDFGHGMESLMPEAGIGDIFRKIVGLFDLIPV